VRNYGLYINGQYIHSGETRESRSPLAPDVVLAKYAHLESQGAKVDESSELLEAALSGARETFAQIQGGFFPLDERLAFIEKLKERMSAQFDALVHSLIHEGAKPLSLARSEVKRSIDTLEWTLIEAPQIFSSVGLPTQSRSDWRTLRAWTERRPRGPLLAITPFNFPLNLVMHKLIPAIAAGCPVILKPSPKAALIGLTIADFCQAAGLPAGMLSVIQCDDAFTERLIKDPRISQISFTGSAPVGWKLAALSTKPISLELGGNAPAYVDESANLEVAAKRLLAGAFAYAGQVCISVQNIYLHPKIEHEFKKIIIPLCEKFPWGDAQNESVLSSAVIDQAAALRLHDLKKSALAAGAHISSEAAKAQGQGATVFESIGNYLAPTLFEKVPKNHPLKSQEIFGPFATLETVSSLSEWINEVNAQPSRLQASVFTQNLGRAFEASSLLNFGGVLINESSAFRLEPMPYGGSGESGVGREGPRFAMEAYTELKSVILSL